MRGSLSPRWDCTMRTNLLVDDDEKFATATAKYLRAVGYDVVTALTSMKALDVLDSRRDVDLVLSDIVLKLGGPAGISLVQMARMKRPGIKVALMTGSRGIADFGAAMPAKLFY